MEVESRNGKLRFSLAGRNSLLYGPLIWYYMKWFNGLGAIAELEGANIYSMYMPPVPSEAHNRQLEGFLGVWLFKKKIPFAVTIGVTDRCQLNCVHCSLPRGAAKRAPLTLAEIKRVVDEAISLGVTNITFTGGEPLLRDGLEECLAAVPPDKAIAQVFTNAVELNPTRAASLKKAGASGVQISLDSPDPEEHDQRRGKRGLFDFVREGVRNALREGLLVGLSTYADNESAAERKLTRLAALAAEWGVREVSVFDLMPTGKLLDRAEVKLTESRRRALLREASALNKKYRGRPRVLTQTWTNSGKGFARAIGCLAAHYQFHISAFGDLMPCDFTPLSFGNIRNESVPSLWHKLVGHREYCKRRYDCRMQDPEFRRKYIEPIPPQADLPFSVDAL